MKKDYYLGLDIGTNSVGWAVTDTDYNLCRFRGKDMWGIRLFNEAKPAADRRAKRTNRRRLQRRNQRIKLLQSLFAEEVYKVDPTFFIRLNESKLWLEDKTTGYKHVLFVDKKYNDRDYHKQYPTQFHLRKELIYSNEPHDIRLVYLALHHIIKNRGHFLISGGLEAAKSFESTFTQFVDELNGNLDYQFEIQRSNEFSKILSDNGMAKSERAKALERLFAIVSEAEDKDVEKKQKASVREICKLISGNQGDIKRIFYERDYEGIEDSLTKFKFSDAKYEDVIVAELESKLPEEFDIVSRIKTLYDWSVLVNILDDEEYLSSAKVKQYELHKRNLKLLHNLLKKYADPKIRKSFFDSLGDGANYSNYVGAVKKNGAKHSVKRCKSEDDFYKNLGKILTGISDAIRPEDREAFDHLMDGVEKHSLLPLQRSKDNSIVPKQVHEQELKKILFNAENYLPFLAEKDESGISVSEKVLSIFNYRIPYFVGPLSKRHAESGSNSWLVRREEGYIYPWNIEDKVDFEKSNEIFIRRMTNKCTYLPWEDVLPKCSLVYQRYMVLNELNNLRVRGRKVSVEVKQEIFHDLFEQRNKVTRKALLTYLQKDDPELSMEMISGFDEDFKASLSSYLDFKKTVFGDRIAEDSIKMICEDIIKWATIYGNDADMLERVVRTHYASELSNEQIKAIRKLKYSGWGQFSRRFLCEIEGTNKETGEVYPIIKALWETNDNLMELLSSEYTFRAEMDTLVKENAGVIDEISYEKLVEGLYTSPANKRAIWQTVQIAEEIRKIMGNEPKKIFVEMARGGEKEKKRTVSRKRQLMALYDACKEDVREWTHIDSADLEKHDEREFNSIKLYLYYTQMGRCAYTGEPIDLDALMSGNSKWDRDHIYPQSRIKDDSIDNLVLVQKVENSKKSNGMLSPEIQKRMYSTWKLWLEKGFISKRKFDRLTRRDDFTADELSGFVARQLVETRQSTKLVAELMDRMYPSSRIVRVKAGLVSDFRQSPLKVLKSRLVNDYHHAKDAYLNIVVGNVYSVRFTDNPREWVKKNKDENWSINKVFYYDVEGAWKAPNKEKGADGKWHSVQNAADEVHTGTIDLVRKTVRKNTIRYTEYTYCETGQLFDETIQRKEKATSIPLKAGLDTSKYGGYTSPNTSYFAQIEFDGKKGERVKNIIGVPIYVANRLAYDPDAFLNYCEQVKGLKNVKIVTPMIKKNSLLVINGFPMRIRGENERDLMFKNNIQPVFEAPLEDTIRQIEKWAEWKKDGHFDNESISESALLRIYDEILSKLKKGKYSKRPANQASVMEAGRNTFIALGWDEKVNTLLNMLSFVRCDIATTADLTDIGGSSNAGSMKINKNTVGKTEKTLVNQSITGLFENRITL